jgi:hypothetical protein
MAGFALPATSRIVEPTYFWQWWRPIWQIYPAFRRRFHGATLDGLRIFIYHGGRRSRIYADNSSNMEKDSCLYSTSGSFWA